MTTAEIIVLPVTCIARSGSDLARQHPSQARDVRNVVELRRARLNRAFERLNRVLDGRRSSAMSRVRATDRSRP
jgi:hypothetical protein